MKQRNLFDPVPADRFQILSRDELIELAKQHQKIIAVVTRDNDRLRTLNEELKQKSLLLEDQYVTIKNKLFGKSSERSKRLEALTSAMAPKSKRQKVQLPSERYPNTPLIERHITLDTLPACKCCGAEMQDSGMTEDSEFLTKIPAQYYVVVQMRHKYACRKCHGNIKTAPAPARIKEGSSYSDEMMIDAAASKYCDLIPIDRQSAIAGREGLKNLPPQSLIEATHYLAEFIRPAYDKIKSEVSQSELLHADETPHRMLEGSDKSGWQLWAFAASTATYFEHRDTRSGDVASEFLIDSKCRFLASDVYSGYGKAVTDTNRIRAERGLPPIGHVYCNAHACNAHARRYFKKAVDRFPDAEFYVDQYKEIYRLKVWPGESHQMR